MIRKIPFYGSSINFADLRRNVLETNNIDSPILFERGDEGEQVENMLAKANAETTLIKILENLNDREKVIFLYQIMKYFGYDITQESLAKTLNFSRISYISLWKRVKVKCEKVLKDSGF